MPAGDRGVRKTEICNHRVFFLFSSLYARPGAVHTSIKSDSMKRKSALPHTTPIPWILLVIAISGAAILFAGHITDPPSAWLDPGGSLRGLLAPLSIPAARLAAVWQYLPTVVFGAVALAALDLSRRLLKSRGRLLCTAGIVLSVVAVWLLISAVTLATGSFLPSSGGGLFFRSLGRLLLIPVAFLYFWFHRLFGGLVWFLPVFFAAVGTEELIKTKKQRRALRTWTYILSLEALLLFLTLSFFFPGDPIPLITAFFLKALPKALGGILFPLLLIVWSFFIFQKITGFSLKRKKPAGGRKTKPRAKPPRKIDLDLKSLPEDKVSPPPPTPETSLNPEYTGSELPVEVDSLVRQTDEVFNRLALPLTHDRTIPGPSTYLLEYRVPESLSLADIRRQEKEIAFRLSEEKGQPLIPIPGKESIGVILQRSERMPLNFKDIAPLLYRPDARLPVYVGRTITGEDFITDLAAAPHLMVAGSTGSGKSVFLHSLIDSLTSGPRRRLTRLVLADPKRVEFGRFASSNNLACPVVEEAAEVHTLLIQLIEIMEERYRHLSKKKVRDLGELHRKEKEPDMPYLVVVIDEVADIFLSEQGKGIKTSVIRLAQKSRAVGIHLVLATQRPSADIVDGLIKANFPTRIAFRTASQVDSRVILDRNGAETLFGKGDGLFVSPESKDPVRFQGAFSGIAHTG